jgi:1-deoxy-D-xylulose-5-phosphate reductoisomerase
MERFEHVRGGRVDRNVTWSDAVAACQDAIRKGGLGPCAANGANEEAVKLFLEDKIGFLDIGRLVEAVVDSDSFGGDYSLADVYECDRMARAFVRAHL